VGTLFAYYLVLRFEPEEIMTTVEMAGCLVCLMGLVLIVFFPQFALSHDIRNGGVWKGIFIDRTSAAKCLVFLLSPALVFGYRRLSYSRMAYICSLAVFIVMAHAVTALIVVCCYSFFMAMLYFLRRLEQKAALVLGAVCIAICLLLIFAAIPYAADIARLFGRDLTLTGRTEVWEVVTRSILKRPLLGYGFYGFWQGMTGESAHAILATHWGFGYAHNGMLEILLQLGFVGLILFLLTLLCAIGDARICLWHGCSIGTDWYIGLIVLTMLYNFDEATVVLPNELLSILYIVACCGLAQAAKKMKEDGQLKAAAHPQWQQ
jgi:O-antigen ligase